MSDLSNLFSKLDERYGLPTAGIAVAGFAAFLLALKAGFHLTNRTLMVSGALFFVACGLYSWHNRDQFSVSYVDEQESFGRWLRDRPWSAFLAVSIFLSMAGLCSYVAWTGGHILMK